MNDHSPVFEEEEFHVRVSEAALVNTPITKLKVSPQTSDPGPGDTVDRPRPAADRLLPSQVTRIQMFHSPPTNVTRVTVAMERVSVVSGAALCMRAGL